MSYNVIRIELTGSGVASWSEFYKVNSKEIFKGWITVSKSEPLTKGAVTYYAPVLTLSGSIDNDTETLIESGYDLVDSYLGVVKEPKNEVIETVVEDELILDDDLPF